MDTEPPFPYTVTVDAVAGTIILHGVGTATTADTIALIESQQQTFRDNPGFHVLYDAVDLQIESNATDMVKVANALFGAGAPPVGRFAIVVPPARVELGMMFTALAQTYGVSAHVFTDRDDAWRWLGREASET